MQDGIDESLLPCLEGTSLRQYSRKVRVSLKAPVGRKIDSNILEFDGDLKFYMTSEMS